jgi:plastocyanin
MRIRLSIATVAAAALALAVPASAGVPQTVGVEDDFFDPDVTEQGVTLSVTWEWADVVNEHNVRQDDKLFRSGSPTANQDESFQIFPSAGTYHYYCELHGGEAGGMDGTLKVSPIFASPFKQGGEMISILWADPSLPGFASGDQFDVQYKVGDREWKYWKKNTSKHGGSFGKNGKPVDVKPGKTYKIRARSEKSSNPKKRSGWSPPLTFVIA